MLRPISSQEWLDKRVREATKAFKDHRLLDTGPGHWRISRPNDGQYWCDIVVLGNCGISVWGDIPACTFAYYGPIPGVKALPEPEQLEAVIAWLGAKPDFGYYGLQKAQIGMGRVGCTECRDEVAIYDLDRALAERADEYGEEWEEETTSRYAHPFGEPRVFVPRRVYTEAITEAITSIRHGEHVKLVKQELADRLREVDSECWEWLSSVGEVPSIRVIYALAAIARLHELLQEVD